MDYPVRPSLLSKLSWFPFSDEPIIQGFWYVPRFQDPTFLFPEESPDEQWHLYVHSWVGIHHFTSASGIVWEPEKMIQLRGHSPFIFHDGGLYYLLYEKHDAPIPLVERGYKFKRKSRISASRIEMRISTDLRFWSDPKLLLDSRDIPFAGDYLKEPRISRPQLIKQDGMYRLFFGASFVTLPQTNQKVSRYLGLAESHTIEGPYTLVNEGRPVMEPIADDDLRNLGTGSVTVVPNGSGVAALQCGAWWDEREAKSKTALFTVSSEDGITWEMGPYEPILFPAQKGWAKGFITSCAAQYKHDEKCWYCYFSANGEHSKGTLRESIGLMIGDDVQLKRMMR